MSLAALVVALPSGEPKVTGLTLSERGRRVARLAGVAPENIHVVRSAAEIGALAGSLAGSALLVLRADGWVVAAPLVEPLRLAEPGSRRAVDAAGEYAGALRVDAAAAPGLLASLATDLGADAGFVADSVPVGRRARHPARTPEELRAADAWQFELTVKPLDAAIVRYFYRPLARPLTRLFLDSPFTPNHITMISVALSLVGCWISAGPSYWAHVIGLLVLVAGGIVDANDGEVARLRLEGSKLGGWLDAIGDDLARIALLLAVGAHMAPRWPSFPVWPVTLAALACTLLTMGLIYWYCIVVAGTSNNQEYGLVLGVGPGASGKPSLMKRLGDVGANVARRDFMDLGVLVLALVNLPVISFAGIVAGGFISLAVVLPTHMKLVKQRREKAAG